MILSSRSFKPQPPHILQPGKYWIGDPCYVFPKDNWTSGKAGSFCEELFKYEGQKVGLILMSPFGLDIAQNISYRPKSIIQGQLDITGREIERGLLAAVKAVAAGTVPGPLNETGLANGGLVLRLPTRFATG